MRYATPLLFLCLACAVPACTGTVEATDPRPDAAAAPGTDASTDAAPATGDGGGPIDAPPGNGFCETAGVVSMEAESYASQTGYELVPHGDASGGSAMRVGADGSLNFDIFLSTGGTYYFWVRALAPDAESNGLFVALDGQRITAPSDNPYAGVPDIFLNKSNVVWFWDPAWQGSGSGAVQGPVTFVASPGQHTLSIQKRKVERPYIDKIVLTLSPDEPAGLGPAETQCGG